jgi:hypothetical protein
LPIGSDTKVKPNTWLRGWPGTTRGAEKALFKKAAKVRNGEDEAAKVWLSHMTRAFEFPYMAARVLDVVRPELATIAIDSLKLEAKQRAAMAGEEIFAEQ